MMNLVENRLVDSVGEGEGGTNCESSIDIYTLSRVKYTVSGKSLYHTKLPAWCSLMT